METCFLSSNSFTKTIELVPSIKTRVFSYPKRTPTLFPSKKLALSSSIACCHSSSSPAGDESIEDDWRSFRARLVANEQAFRPNYEHSSMENPPQINIGDKWVHPIHEPEKGCLLIATEKLDGVHIFERTVILLLSMGTVGPYGIILNRPSLMSIKEMRSTVLDASGMFSERPLFFGGPLEEGLFLVSPKKGQENERVGKSGVFEQVMKGLYYGTKESAGCAAEMVKRDVVDTGDLRFYDGYCGWEMRQLREEIMAGYWTVASCSPTLIGLQNLGTHRLWEEIIGLMGPKKVW